MSESVTIDAEHMRQVIATTQRICALASDIVAPLRIRFADPAWRPEFKRILIMAVRSQLNTLETEALGLHGGEK